jgi:hypothetical protein
MGVRSKEQVDKQRDTMSKKTIVMPYLVIFTEALALLPAHHPEELVAYVVCPYTRLSRRSSCVQSKRTHEIERHSHTQKKRDIQTDIHTRKEEGHQNRRNGCQINYSNEHRDMSKEKKIPLSAARTSLGGLMQTASYMTTKSITIIKKQE